MKRIIVTIVLMTITLIVGFILGRQSVTEESIPQIIDSFEESISTETTTSEEPEVESSTTTQVDGEVKVEASQLTPEQRKLLGTFGIDADGLVVTATMITCAEAKIGKARLGEIFAGATPTFFEGADLFSCYQQ